MNLIYFTASYLVVNVIISYIVAVVYKLACFALCTLLLLTLEAIQGKCECSFLILVLVGMFGPF